MSWYALPTCRTRCRACPGSRTRSPRTFGYGAPEHVPLVRVAPHHRRRRRGGRAGRDVETRRPGDEWRFSSATRFRDARRESAPTLAPAKVQHGDRFERAGAAVHAELLPPRGFSRNVARPASGTPSETVHHRTRPRSVCAASGPAHANAQYALQERTGPRGAYERPLENPPVPLVCRARETCARRAWTPGTERAFTPNDRTSASPRKKKNRCAPPEDVSGCTSRRHSRGRARINDASETFSAERNSAACRASSLLAPGAP